METIRINVGGRQFLTYRRTIEKLPQSKLADALTTRSHYDSSLECYFFDRSAEYFSVILEGHRKGAFHFPAEACAIEMVEELEYWNLPLSLVAPCCLGKIQEAQTDKEISQNIREELYEDCEKSLNALNRVPRKGFHGYRIKLWMFMQIPAYSDWARIWSIFIALMVIGSLLTFAIHFDSNLKIKDSNRSLMTFQENMMGLVNTTKWRSIWKDEAPYWGIPLDLIFNSALTLDFIIRFVVCPYKLHFLRSWVAVVDMLVLFSYWGCVAIFFQVYFNNLNPEMPDATQWFWMTTMVIQMVRPFRILGLSRTFVGLNVLLMVIRKSFHELVTVFICLLIGMVIFSFLIYTSEIATEGVFTNLWEGCWWSLATMTTVGYGDMVPKRWPGYLVGMVCAVTGIIITGLCIPILSNNFNRYYSHVHLVMDEIKTRLEMVRSGGGIGPEQSRDRWAVHMPLVISAGGGNKNGRSGSKEDLG